MPNIGSTNKKRCGRDFTILYCGRGKILSTYRRAWAFNRYGAIVSGWRYWYIKYLMLWNGTDREIGLRKAVGPKRAVEQFYWKPN